MISLSVILGLMCCAGVAYYAFLYYKKNKEEDEKDLDNLSPYERWMRNEEEKFRNSQGSQQAYNNSYDDQYMNGNGMPGSRMSGSPGDRLSNGQQYGNNMDHVQSQHNPMFNMPSNAYTADVNTFNPQDQAMQQTLQQFQREAQQQQRHQSLYLGGTSPGVRRSMMQSQDQDFGGVGYRGSQAQADFGDIYDIGESYARKSTGSGAGMNNNPMMMDQGRLHEDPYDRQMAGMGGMQGGSTHNPMMSDGYDNYNDDGTAGSVMAVRPVQSPPSADQRGRSKMGKNVPGRL